MKKLFRLFIALCASFILFGLGGTVLANTPEKPVITESITVINPIYSDVLSESDLREPDSDLMITQSEDGKCLSEAEIVALIRQEMLKRNETISFYYQTNAAGYSQIVATVENWVSTAVSDDGSTAPEEGDSLAYQHGGYLIGYSHDSNYKMHIVLTMTYYTTAEQEKVLTKKVNDLIDSFHFTDTTSEYQKIKTIYDYICSHVTYDHTNLKDQAYTLKYTAYAALINKTAVCQGYSVLFYRLAKEVGISTRVVTGKSNGDNHAWNICKIGNWYYSIDSTWDEGEPPYKYFLLGTHNFYDVSQYDSEGQRINYHDLGESFKTTSFKAQYPLSETDYDDVSLWEKTQSGSVLTLTKYNGSARDVVIPNAGDFSGVSEVHITKAAMQSAGSVANTLTISDKGEKIIADGADWSETFNEFYYIQSIDLSRLDTAQITNMSGMFNNCQSLTALNISGFDTRKVTDVSDMFFACLSLPSLNLSGFNTSNVTDMNYMFGYCQNLSQLDLSSFNTAKVENMEGMFYECINLTTIYTKTTWTTSHLRYSTNYLFTNCNKLIGGNGTRYNQNNNYKTYARVDTAETPGYFTLHSHVWDQGTITTFPTKTATGIKTFTCSVCQETKTEIISKLTHDYGDVNGNDTIDAVDALQDLRHAVGEKPLTGEPALRGDVDQNNTTNSADALQILQKSVGIINIFVLANH